MYKLTIIESLNYIKLMRQLKAFNPRLSLKDVKIMVDMLCENNGYEIVFNDRFESPQAIYEIFNDVSKYKYEEIMVECFCDREDSDLHLYTVSRLWYNKLAKEDQQKVDCLIRNSPVALVGEIK